jgi:single-stranded-DNA-specific exonuclease
MLQAKSRWTLKKSDDNASDDLAKSLKISSLVAKLLINRGITSTEEARQFLFTDEESFHDPYLLPDMELAVKRINKAIDQEESILVFGDYDADGVTSTTVMMTALLDMGANARFYIPNRFTEGYGPNQGAFQWAKDEGFSVIVTVDTGISAVEEALFAKELGLDLIITDHHEPGPNLPEAIAIVHPNIESSQYPFKQLAGVGVAWKLAHALYGERPDHLLDLVAIGTVADLVKLHGENRAIVKKGLSQLRQSVRLGINVLLQVSNIKIDEISEETIGFTLAPRINAVGRLQDADMAVDLLMSTNLKEAETMAHEMNRLNKERQQIVNDMTSEAIEIADQMMTEDTQVLVVGKEGWNAGVVGIVASRLVDRYYRPAIVLGFDKEKDQAKGSARSIIGFDLYENLSLNRDVLPHFGGHPMAAGMTLKLEDVSTLRKRLNEQAKAILSDDDFSPITEVEVKVNLEDIDLKTIEDMSLLAPFGMGNPKPTVMIEDITFINARKIGASQTHLKLTLINQTEELDAIGFGLGTKADEIAPMSKLSVIGELSINEWNNRRKPQIMLKDIKIEEWQLFDIRGQKNTERWYPTIPANETILIAFQQNTIDEWKLSETIHYVKSDQEAEDLDLESKSIVLLDLPVSVAHLDLLLSGKHPDRIYALFNQGEGHFFKTLPNRDHFKWFYGFLAKRDEFDLSRFGEALAKHRGWSMETIDFMSKVFFELNFVKIENGLITLNHEKSKRELTESASFRNKQALYSLEQELLYSSYQELKAWFNQKFARSVIIKEEAKAWI